MQCNNFIESVGIPLTSDSAKPRAGRSEQAPGAFQSVFDQSAPARDGAKSAARAATGSSAGQKADRTARRDDTDDRADMPDNAERAAADEGKDGDDGKTTLPDAIPAWAVSAQTPEPATGAVTADVRQSPAASVAEARIVAEGEAADIAGAISKETGHTVSGAVLQGKTVQPVAEGMVSGRAVDAATGGVATEADATAGDADLEASADPTGTRMAVEPKNGPGLPIQKGEPAPTTATAALSTEKAPETRQDAASIPDRTTSSPVAGDGAGGTPNGASSAGSAAAQAMPLADRLAAAEQKRATDDKAEPGATTGEAVGEGLDGPEVAPRQQGAAPQPRSQSEGLAPERFDRSLREDREPETSGQDTAGRGSEQRAPQAQPQQAVAASPEMVSASNDTGPAQVKADAAASDLQPLAEAGGLDRGMPESARSATGSTSPHPPLAEAPRPAMRMMAESLHRAADGSVELTLSPEELGRVRLTLSPAETGITVNITADRAETLDLMRRHADLLNGAMRELGYGDVFLDFGGSGQQRSAEQFTDGAASDPRQDGETGLAPETAAQAPSSRLAGLDLRL